MRQFDSGTYFRLVDLLIQQTGLENIRWEPGYVQGAVRYTSGSGVTVMLEPNSSVQAFPITFRLLDKDDDLVARFVTGETSTAEETAWDDRIRTLWGLVGPLNDPAKILIRELEDLPPW